MDKKNSIRRAKRPVKIEENFWDCSVCTYRNNAEAFKCSMCDVRKGTSTRKPRLNPALVAAQVVAPTTPSTSTKRSRSGTKHKKRRDPPRLKNVDRSSAQTREVTVNSVTVVITEYKPLKTTGSTSSSEPESNETRA